MESLKHLVTEFKPTNYKLTIDISKRLERIFTGTVIITGELLQNQNYITLHAKDLEISKAYINEQKTTIQLNNKDSEVTLTASDLQPGKYRISLEFSGKITDPMNGLYPCYFKLDGKDEELLATQFESHYAREVFPCIDEPEAKATFDLTIVSETNITLVSNTPIMSQQTSTQNLTTSFETTPVMSTYLLAWVAGKLDYLEAKTAEGVTVRTYATPDKVAKTKVALDAAVKILDFYNKYFAIKYPLSKCDLLGLPDFSSGAMENWGCITFRESAFLVDEHSAVSVKQYVATVVAHELAHQWFGNLVTMKWWNDLWLNESFASWIEYLALDYNYPEWKPWTQFYDSETTHALDRDSLASVQKIRQDINSPEEIGTLFDGAIVYAKGASLLHMLHAYIGADAFRDGLRIYLNRHQFANAEANDLWQALSEASNLDVSSFMEPWITQAGHPVVTVTQSQDQVSLHQQRFFSNPTSKDDQTIWPVPLLAGEHLKEKLFNTSQGTFALQPSQKPLLLNKGRTGFYLTAYSPEHIVKLAEEIKDGNIDLLDRLGLLSESYDLASAGKQSTLQMLHLLEAYEHESEEPVWGAITSAVGALRILINEDPQLKPHLQRFVIKLAREQYNRLGWQRKANETYFDELLRPTIVSLMCYGENQQAIDQALKDFTAATQPEDILGDIRSTVLAVGVKFGGEEAFTKLLSWYKDQSSAEMRIQVAAGITSTRSNSQTKQLLAMLKTKDIKLQDIFYWFIYLLRNPYTRTQMWQWMQDNWAWIDEKFGNDMHFSDFPIYCAGSFSTEEELISYKAFFTPKANNLSLKRPIAQGIETIESRILWRKRDLTDVTNYLQAF